MSNEPGAADGVVDLGGGAVQRDLHVDVVAGGQPRGHLRRDPHPVGGELHPDVVRGGVVHQLPEVRAHSGFAAADVDVEHLHAFQLVDDVLALPGGQLPRIALARRRQAVHARQVAGVGQLPGQADRRVQAVLELLDRAGARTLRSVIGSSSRHQHVGIGQHTQRVQVGPCVAILDPGGAASGPDVGMVGQRLHHRRGWCGSSETTACGCRSDRAARRTVPAEPPPGGATASRDRGRTHRPGRDRAGAARSVDPAHSVDGHLFNQGLGDELGVGARLLVVHVICLLVGSRQQGWFWSRSSSQYGIECRNGRAGSDAAESRVGPAPLDDAAPHHRRGHRVVRRPGVRRRQRRRRRAGGRHRAPHAVPLLRLQERHPLGRVRHPPRAPARPARQRRPAGSARRGAARGAVGVQHL